MGKCGKARHLLDGGLFFGFACASWRHNVSVRFTFFPFSIAAVRTLGLAGWVFALLIGPWAQAQAQADGPRTRIFKSLNKGTPTFSDVPPTRGAYVVYRPSCYACNVNSQINWNMTKLNLTAFEDEIARAAKQFDLDPALVRAVIHAESNFNARARSPKGAMGLMQLMPGTAYMLGVIDPADPALNIRGGTQYLASLLQRFKNNTTLATAAYNAGPEAVQKYAGVPPYAETRVYVDKVMALYARYREAMGIRTEVPAR